MTYSHHYWLAVSTAAAELADHLGVSVATETTWPEPSDTHGESLVSAVCEAEEALVRGYPTVVRP